MNDRLKNGVLYATSALVMSAVFVVAPVAGIFGDSETGINSASSTGAVYAQAKKKPVAKAAPKRASGPNLNTGEVNSYLNRMREKLDQNWELPDGKNKVTITATVNADGSTADVSASSSPTNQSAEQAANEAFAKIQPLESMPGSAGERVKLTLTFDSFADPHGDTNRNISTRMDPIMTPKPAAESAPSN